MTPEQLDLVVARTGHEAYRRLTSDANPDEKSREHFRRVVEDKAEGRPPAPPAEPSTLRKAVNLATASYQHLANGCREVDKPEYDRRRAICRACPTGHYDASRDTCLACGCGMARKAKGAAWSCDLGHWDRPDEHD